MTTEVETKPDGNGTVVVVDDAVLKAVAERLEFFFSDANVRSDKFMRTKILSQETKGFIPIEALLKFNSIKQHTTDAAVVIAAAKTLPKLKLSDDETSIARVTPFTLRMMDDNIPLSLYVMNLPVTSSSSSNEDGKETQYAVSMQDLRNVFAPYGKVTLVKLRYHWSDKDASPSKVPMGEAFVEFETLEEQEAAVKDLCPTTKSSGEDGNETTVEPPKKTLMLKDNALKVIPMREWMDARSSNRKEKKHEQVHQASKNKRERQDKNNNDKSQTTPPVQVKEFKLDWKPGCVISIKGLSETMCDREAIRATIAKGLDVDDQKVTEMGIYADYSRGQTSGAIRFAEPNDKIKDLADKLASGELEIAGAKVESASILQGDEETKYWSDFIEFKTKQLRHKDEEKASRKKARHRR